MQKGDRVAGVSYALYRVPAQPLFTDCVSRRTRAITVIRLRLDSTVFGSAAITVLLLLRVVGSKKYLNIFVMVL